MREQVIPVSPADLQAKAQQLLAQGARLVTMVGTDERESEGGYALRYLFGLPRMAVSQVSGPNAVPTEGAADSGDMTLLTLLTRLDPDDPEFPSLTLLTPAAQWYEREVHDLLGLVPVGHPDPRPLVLHPPWPSGRFPLRKDFIAPTPEELAEAGWAPADGTPMPGTRVVGDGVMAIPVGPIHAGIIEPGHFRFGAVGETVLHLDATLFYTHRGLEKQAEGRGLDGGLEVAERSCGTCTVSHATSYAQAAESALGLQVPRRATYLRTFFLELERLYNHVGDVGNVCAGAGFAFGVSQGARLKEALQRLNAQLTGHRFLRGALAVGGARLDLSPEGVRQTEETLALAEREFHELTEVLFSNTSLMDRMATTGVLTRQAAVDLGVTGVAARASGLAMDARLDWPHAAYVELQPRLVSEAAGDVLARVRVRVGEVDESLRLLRAVLDGLPEGPVRLSEAEVSQALAGGNGRSGWRTGIGITESARGENAHWVMIGPDGRLARLRIRSASYTNWPAVPLTVPGNIVPDFPLINKSFELCYGCLDR